MEFGHLLGPDFPHGQDTLTGNFPTIFEGNSVVGHLFCIPARTDAEQKASVGDSIQTGNFLR